MNGRKSGFRTGSSHHIIWSFKINVVRKLSNLSTNNYIFSVTVLHFEAALILTPKSLNDYVFIALIAYRYVSLRFSAFHRLFVRKM